ncbi:hypothetical protein [Kibdelosporangium phytohabitans]|nr:hypothetical protein [Kibdelosporangium phytohabitans]MBE1469132.1 hemin uptake protein HemP [Kibdelosporangium phytohabitans]
MSGRDFRRAERGQRRHHPEFRIAAPDWSAEARTRLRALLDAATGAAAQPSADETELHEKDLAEAATNLWRARKRLERTTNGSKETRHAGRLLHASHDALGRAGLVIQDHDGAVYHPGHVLEVLAFQQDPAFEHDVVIETKRPSLYLSGRQIQIGQVIVGCPVTSEDDNHA